ncbi:MAG: PEGA domain-containing protein [Ignavibacteriae bacterium]|nr:PEGA domain-containing protein [Ignavibacteriota bacterium]
MKKISIITASLIVLVVSIYLTSCATIATGTSQLVTITSNVEGADVKLDGVSVGKTPFTGEIKKNGKLITIEMEGYKTHQIALSTTMEGMFWGNIIIGGTLGSITDFATGAAYKYSPASYQVELIANGLSVNDFKKKYELKKFAMVNMSNIAIDLSNNNGNYLNSLLYLANLEQNENSTQMVKNILIKSNGDQVTFGIEIEKLLNI